MDHFTDCVVSVSLVQILVCLVTHEDLTLLITIRRKVLSGVERLVSVISRFSNKKDISLI